MVWLYCDLQNWGKTVIRQGWREALPIDKPPIWVFCPLLRKQFPRDRKLVCECEKCSHHKGVSHDLTRFGEVAQNPFQPFQKVNGKRESRRILYISKKEIEELLKRDRKWREEEEVINLVGMIYQENKCSSSQSDM